MCRTKLVSLESFEPVADDHHCLTQSDISSESSDSPMQSPVVKSPSAQKQKQLPAPNKKNLSNRYREIKPWTPIELPADVATMATFPAGFKVEVYDGHLTQHFTANSNEVVPTVGALKYVEHFNETGPYGRFRFQLCHNYACGRCNRGYNCTYLHINRLPEAHTIHLQGGSYTMMPKGVSLFVHTPHTHHAPQIVPSEYLIQTQGSIQMMNSILEGKQATVQRPQHCAHFQYKRMCNRGYECNFIHSTVPAPR
jgi:hypothetical protein